jgi:hypothetical protein
MGPPHSNDGSGIDLTNFFVGSIFAKSKKYKKLLYLSIFSTLLRFGPSTHAGMGLVRTGKRMGSLSPA